MFRVRLWLVLIRALKRQNALKQCVLPFSVYTPAICDRYKNVLMKHKNSNKSVEECIYGTVDLG